MSLLISLLWKVIAIIFPYVTDIVFLLNSFSIYIMLGALKSLLNPTCGPTASHFLLIAWVTVSYFFACLIIFGWKLDNLDNMLWQLLTLMCTFEFLLVCFSKLPVFELWNLFPLWHVATDVFTQFLFILILNFKTGFLGGCPCVYMTHKASPLSQWICLRVGKTVKVAANSPIFHGSYFLPVSLGSSQAGE